MVYKCGLEFGGRFTRRVRFENTIVTNSATILRGAPRGAAVLSAVVAMLLLAGCTEESAEPVTPVPDPIVLPMPEIAPAVWDARGRIVSEEPLTDVDPQLLDKMGEGRRAVYRSASGISGAGTEVSGTFFVPKGTPPPGGWPVISLAHGTTGLVTECAPSETTDLRGFGASVAALLAGGLAVAFTDYEGLGLPGTHPFLEPRTAAFNVIDAVRALRALYPDVSARWLAMGHSQGGQAAWSADEVNSFYGGGLNLVGAFALAPAANLAPMPELADRGRLTNGQLALMPMVVVGAQRSFPAGSIDQLRHGETLRNKDVLIGCTDESQRQRERVLRPADVKPNSRTDVIALTDSLRKLALPKAPLSAPMLVMVGSDDEVMPPRWIRTSVARSCQLGGQILFRELPGVGHGGVGPDEEAVAWMNDRFAGAPAPSNCAEL